MKVLTGVLLGAAALAGPSILATFPTMKLTSCSPITNVALSTTAEPIFAADPDRQEICIGNSDAAIRIHIALGTTAATTAWTSIGPGGSACWNVEHGRIPTGVVGGLAASGAPAITGHSCK